jgi:hypothetical protein
MISMIHPVLKFHNSPQLRKMKLETTEILLLLTLMPILPYNAAMTANLLLSIMGALMGRVG